MSDTTPEAAKVQARVLRAMSMERRFQLLDELCEAARSTSMAGIRARHPTYSDQEVRWALWRMIYGDDLFGRAWPSAPLLAP